MDSRATESVPADDSSAQILAAWPAGRVVAERYEIGEVLGIGGSSVIYRAFDRLLNRPVALKVLRHDRISPAAVGRLKREVAVARNASSPNLVRVFDIGEAGTDTFVTMELVDGESLRRRLERGPLSIPDTLAIAKQILRGLAVLHATKIVHRDIKPSNVLVDSSGSAKLADFGLAVDPADDKDRPTQTGTLVGTAEYMSPEQVTGAPLDARSDLYSFGVLLYECLTGQLPFGSRSSVAALLAHVRERPRSVRELRPEVPAWLSRLVARLLAKDAALRFGSADAVLQLIEEERAPRNWRAAMAIVAALLLLATMLVAVTRLVPAHRTFARLRATPAGGVEALDADGHVLWSNAHIDTWCAAVARLKDGSRKIVAIPDASQNLSAVGRSTALLIDPSTGSVTATVKLPDPALIAFPEFTNSFACVTIVAVDFEHDGDDEIVFTYNHHRYWPNYAIVYDLGRSETRLIVIHSGGTRFAGVADVNGDGRDDLLLFGLNNRLGWYGALAAFDVPAPSLLQRGQPVTGSPDTIYPESEERYLLWYELLPPRHGTASDIAIDSARREITLPYPTGGDMTVRFDGFRSDMRSQLPAPARQESRKAAYAKMRDAERSRAAGDPEAAAIAATAAAELADSAGDPSLAEWCRRLRIRAIIDAGRTTEAETATTALITGSLSAADIAWDTANELHLTGHLTEAARWYWTGLVAGRNVNTGRLRYEFIEGAVLALVEQKRWRDAEDFVSRVQPVLNQFPEEPEYINYIHWRRGDTDFIPLDAAWGDPDLSRYWALEFAHASGTRGSALLEKIAAEEKQGTSYPALVASLKAVALAEAGQRQAAANLIADILPSATASARTDIAYRAHLDLIRERAAMLGR